MANLPENARTDSITAPEPLQRGRLSLVYEPVQDIARSVDDLRKSGVSLEKIVVVEESSLWPGELLFQTFGPEQVFYDRHKEYISRYSVLSQLVNLETFTSQLQGEGYAVVFASNTAHILKSYEGWSNPLHIEGYTLYPFQSFGLNRALEQPLYFFNWSPGSGKSHCSAAGAKVLFQRGQIEQVLAFTLSKLKENLRREFDRAGLDAVVNDGTRPKRLKGYEAEHQVYVMNYEKSWVDNEALTELTKNRPTLFVLDECHKVINDTGANKSRKAIDRLIVENRPYKPRVWPMSASVVGGNPLRYRDVFSIGKSTNPLGTKKDFVDSYASDVKTQEIATRSGGRFTVTHYEWDLPNLQEIRHRVADRTQAIRKTDPGVRDQFKGIQSLIQPIQMTGPERELTDIITERAREAYEERGENLAPYYWLLRYACNTPLAIARTQDEIGQEIAKDHPGLVKDAMCSKLEYLNEQLEGIRDAGDKVLVFLHWTNFGLHLISDKIAVPHVDHYGTGQTNKESQAVQDRFKNNPDITCFLTSDAGSHGLNMQCARHVIQYDPLYSYDDTVQRASRIDRADSHLDGLTNFIYCTEDSVEQRVVEIQEQRRVISEAVQGTVETIDTKNRASQSETQNLCWLIFGRD